MARHVERVVSRRDATSQVEFGIMSNTARQNVLKTYTVDKLECGVGYKKSHVYPLLVNMKSCIAYRKKWQKKANET